LQKVITFLTEGKLINFKFGNNMETKAMFSKTFRREIKWGNKVFDKAIIV